MNRQTTRLMVPYYEREKWDEAREEKRIGVLHKSDKAFTQHMMALQLEKASLSASSNRLN